MSTMQQLFDAVRAMGLAYPDTYEESPWGERALKVRKKTFVFLGGGDTYVSFSLKLPDSKADALDNDYANPTHYGMGKHGWVTFRFEPGDTLPTEQIRDWVDESFRAVAPKTLIKKLGMEPPPLNLDAQPEPEPDVDGVPRVLLVGDDPLRLARARRALAEHGIGAIEAAAEDATLDLAGDGQPELIVVDVGRNASTALPLAGQLAGVCFEATLVIAGLRDPKHERKASDLVPSAKLTRDPPGDDASVELIRQSLS